MRDREELLQERLEQLERGVSLEECVQGLGEEDATLLRTAAELRTTRFPQRDPQAVTEQRAAFVRQAKERRHMNREPASKPRTRREQSPFTLWGWLPLPAAAALVVVLLVAASVVALVGSSPGGSPGDSPGTDTGGQIAGEAPADEAGPVLLAAPDPQRAVLRDTRGLVEIRSGDGDWQRGEAGQLISSADAVRTGALSAVTLAFYDGSAAHLGPATEVVVDDLAARTDGGPRVVALTQLRGETEHDVAETAVEGSLYAVHTGAGSGLAQGTKFKVVAAAAFTRFYVTEGSVAVSNLDVVVTVVAGQATTINLGEAPLAPVFLVSGDGEVFEIGSVWIVAGQSLLTDSSTVIVGSPQPGDWVAFEGRILIDGTRLVDKILLLWRHPANRFALTGAVDAIGDTQWTIAGRNVGVDGETAIDEGIAVDDRVAASGVVLADGSLLAKSIRRLDDRQFFEFTGVVESMGNPWRISGRAIAVDENTEIEGVVTQGDLVSVEGRVLDDGTWLAREIEAADDDEREFEFTGTVDNTDPWEVSGITLATDERTEIEGDIGVGDRVEVEGEVLEDGTWLASEIELVDKAFFRFHLVGQASGVEPLWVVAGVPFTVDGDTEIDDGIEVGDLVKVKGRILEDGTLLAEKIKLIAHLGLGCFSYTGAVNGFEEGKITLHNWQTIVFDDEVEFEDDDLEIGSVILVQVCVDDDGNVTVVRIIIIFFLDEVPLVPVLRDDDDDDDDDDD